MLGGAHAQPVAKFYSFVMTSSVLLHSLREYRQIRSSLDKIPLYCVFGDTVIRSIASSRPASKQALLAIPGISEEKCQLYGDDIIRLVKTSKDQKQQPSTCPPVVVRHGNSVLSRQKAPFHPLRKRQPFAKPSACEDEGVYILELKQGMVYVGYSTNRRQRVQQHMAGRGSAFTRAYPPTGVMLPRLGCVSGSPEAAERDETLRYMFLRGIPFVRGWKYVRVDMPDSEIQDAEENIRELFDLCRRCGHPGHFVSQCKAGFDRLGRPCKI